MTSCTAIPAADVSGGDGPVRISVLVIDNGGAEGVDVSGPMRRTVRAAFAHPRLASPLQALQMDADRLIARIAARWEKPGFEHETSQTWEKSNGSTTVRWWVDRDLRRLPRSTPPRITAV